MTESGNKWPRETAIRNGEGWPTEAAITSFTSSLECSWTTEPPWWISQIIEGVAPHADGIANGEADSPLWVAAWLEQVPTPTLSLAEIREAMGYRH
jgi:hypothetical protein